MTKKIRPMLKITHIPYSKPMNDRRDVLEAGTGLTNELRNELRSCVEVLLHINYFYLNEFVKQHSYIFV